MIKIKNILIVFLLIGIVNILSANSLFDPYLKAYNIKVDLLNSLPKNHKYKIVMLGDSIIAGGHWKTLLKNDKVLNLGVGSDLTDITIENKKYGLINRIDKLNSRFKKAFIMIGINDFGFQKSVDEVFNTYIKIIKKIQDKKIEPIIQSTLYIKKNKYGFDYEKMNKKVKELNYRLYNYCKKNNLVYIDITKELTKDNLLIKEYTWDGVHLNKKGYEIWSEIIKKKM